jgi:hypothetical protein
MGMVCIASLPSMVPPCWTCFVLFHFMFHWFIINGHCLHCIVCSVSFHASLVHSYCTSLVLFHFPHWFITAGHGLYCFTFCFTGPSLLGMDCIVSLHTLLVLPFWAWFVLFHFMIHWFFLNGHDFIISLYDSLVLLYWAWFVLLHFMLQWFLINVHCVYCFISLTGSSLLGMACIVSLHASLVHH